MKSIDLNDFTKVGFIIKSHGNNGFLKISLEKNIKLKEWVMFLIKQKPVPFFVEEWQRTNDSEAILKCQDINSVDEAESYVGVDVLLIKSEVKRKKGNLDVSIIGYLIFVDGFGEIGTLNEILEMPGQTMLQTFYKEQEILIPAVEEFVVEINDKKKQITLSLPEGFLDLNA